MAATVFDIARRHVRLPLRSDYAALKTALRDWLAYTERAPLHTRPAYYAEVHIRVTRDGYNNNRTSDNNNTQTSLYKRWAHATATTRLQQRPDETQPQTHVYTKALPLRVWTAVLPWETQRGLSHASLHAEHAAANAAAAAVAAASDKVDARDDDNKDNKGSHNDNNNNDDPYGVVSAPAAHTCTPSSVDAVAPGMLFLMSRSSVAAAARGAGDDTDNSDNNMTAATATTATTAAAAAGDRDGRRGSVCFWSGAITQPIDVLFAAAVAPSAVAQSSSFATLRRLDTALRVADSHIAADVAREYFAYNELHSSVVTLTLCAHGHLDPRSNNNNSNNNSNNDEDDNKDDDASSASPTRTYQVSCPAYASATPTTSDATAAAATPADEVVQYVIETRRHFLRDGVQQALRESAQAMRRAHVMTATQQQQDDDADDSHARIDITVELSTALKDDLLRKAQLAVHYVPTLEHAIVHHLHQRHYRHDNNSDSNSDSEQPPREATASTTRAGTTRRMRVWLSDEESVWVTPDELKQMQQQSQQQQGQDGHGVAQDDTHTAANRDTDDDDDDDAYMQARDDDDDDADNDNDVEHAVATVDVHAVTTAADDSGHVTQCDATAGALRVHEARRLAPRQQRAMAAHSDQLASEDESRPTHLTPSFVGRHEVAVLQQQQQQQSGRRGWGMRASALARYPRTHSHMPADAPIDYELFDLCLRLGVGCNAVVHAYYARMLREWSQMLHQLRQHEHEQQRQRHDGNDTHTSTTSSARMHVSLADVQRMHALVTDAALQVPPELCALVEAVARRCAAAVDGHATSCGSSSTHDTSSSSLSHTTSECVA